MRLIVIIITYFNIFDLCSIFDFNIFDSRYKLVLNGLINY